MKNQTRKGNGNAKKEGALCQVERSVSWGGGMDQASTLNLESRGNMNGLGTGEVKRKTVFRKEESSHSLPILEAAFT